MSLKTKMVTSGMSKLLVLEAVWWLGGHLEPRRMPKMQPQRAKFEEEGGGRVSGSLKREGHGTQTELHVWRQGWGHLRAGVNLLPSLAEDVLSCLLETGASETEDRWERERRSPQGLMSPHSAYQTKGGYLLACPQKWGRQGRQCNWAQRSECQDQQNPALALNVRITLDEDRLFHGARMES